MALLPPPLGGADDGGVTPSPPAPPSFLNDVSQLRLPRSGVFTSFSSVRLAGVNADRAFDGLYPPAAGAANLSAYKPSCDYEVLALERTNLEPQVLDEKHGAWNAPYTLVDALTAQDAWPLVSHFRFVERVPVLWGLWTHRVPIEAWRACDRANRFARYSSVAQQGRVRVWKYAWVVPAAGDDGVDAHGNGGGGCVVHEHIVGVISQTLFRSMAEQSCRKLHQQHLDNFPSLFTSGEEAAAPASAAAAAAASAHAAAAVSDAAESKQEPEEAAAAADVVAAAPAASEGGQKEEAEAPAQPVQPDS